MAENKENIVEMDKDSKSIEISSRTSESGAKVVGKNIIPHFFPTYRIKRNLYPIPISLVVIIAGILAYLTYVVVGVQIDGGYFPETEYGAIGGVLNGIIYTAIAALSGFIIIYIIKKKGINVLMYIFGIGFGMVGFLQTWFFGEIILFWLSQYNLVLYDYYYLFDVGLIIFTAVFTIVMIYKYFTST